MTLHLGVILISFFIFSKMYAWNDTYLLEKYALVSIKNSVAMAKSANVDMNVPLLLPSIKSCGTLRYMSRLAPHRPAILSSAFHLFSLLFTILLSNQCLFEMLSKWVRAQGTATTSQAIRCRSAFVSR
jgi:hypothetical protein